MNEQIPGWIGYLEIAASRKGSVCDGHLVKPVSLPDLEKPLAELKDRGVRLLDLQ